MAPQVFLRLPDGKVRLTAAATLGELRAECGAQSDQMRLVSAGHDLLGAEADAHGLSALSTIYVVPRLLGGGKKRKKKTYTKPKKVKHKHKTVKTAVLKYYKVDGDGKIDRLRRECPEPVCGPGVFMASHTDRMYCGRCSLTLVHETN